MICRRILLLLIAISASAALLIAARPKQPADTLPTTLSDDEFWRLSTTFSEQAGNFRFQFMSNEREFPEVIPELKHTIKGGVYLGVGPEQNFTYIAAVEPRMAFVFDIRRQNMTEHLIYKALFELSADRNEFVSRLFSRKPLNGWTNLGTVKALFQGYSGTQPDRQLFTRNLKAIKDDLVQQHHFQLSASDLTDIDEIYDSFYSAGPGATSSFGFRGGNNNYAALMTSADDQGQTWSYLANEDNFKSVKELERKNLIVPLVGNFAGDKAIRAVGKYVKDHAATVSAFYCSNVEQYLFQQGDDWRRFYTNISALPLDGSSTFIRSSHFAYGTAQQRRQYFGGTTYYMLLASMSELVKSLSTGKIKTYDDVIRLSR